MENDKKTSVSPRLSSGNSRILIGNSFYFTLTHSKKFLEGARDVSQRTRESSEIEF